MKKLSFSQRYGYTKVEDVIIRECMPDSVKNAILNALKDMYDANKASGFVYVEMNNDFWRYYLNKPISTGHKFRTTADDYLYADCNLWYSKLNLLEWMIDYLRKSSIPFVVDGINRCVDCLNQEFERLNYAYRIIDNQIVEIVSEDEIASIKETLDSPIDNIKVHMQTALQHISASNQNPDYRNSIKESISAVECYCRMVTKATTLGAALKNIENKGVTINATLKLAMEKLYGYTNNPDTGIRHALLDDANPPTFAEAIYMLVTCSAFINYLTKKGITVQP